MELKAIQDGLSKELISNSSDILIDISEIGLDNILDEGLINDIPLLKTVASVCKIGLNIRERHFAKKLISFINNYRNGEIDTEEYNTFLAKMENCKFKNNVTETIIICLDKLDNVSKTKILSQLFISFINGRLIWEQFVRFSNVINYLETDDYETLQILYENNNKAICFSNHEKRHLEGPANKLVQLSLINFNIVTETICGSSPSKMFYKINNMGVLFFESVII